MPVFAYPELFLGLAGLIVGILVRDAVRLALLSALSLPLAIIGTALLSSESGMLTVLWHGLLNGLAATAGMVLALVVPVVVALRRQAENRRGSDPRSAPKPAKLLD